jgi:ubiquinone/menaquinone biosynthesis C-methylase UbiE
MKRLLTIDDLVETHAKIRQRGVVYVLRKFIGTASSRTCTAFNTPDIPSYHAWSIPGILQRWNRMITGDPNQGYESYIADKYLAGRNGLRLLSLGSGVCSHEMNFARNPSFSEVRCVDLAGRLLEEAREQASAMGLINMTFKTGDAGHMEFAEDHYDMTLFHSSLHHFRNLDILLGQKIRRYLKKEGLLVIHEYVGPNRLHWTTSQLREVNRILNEVLPAHYKIRYSTGRQKTKVTGPGWIRMVISDPSEAAESEQIKPLIRKYYKTLEEKPLGGNILLPLLKDISHHFTDGSEESKQWLDKLFQLEEQYLQKESSQIIFGIYSKRE